MGHSRALRSNEGTLFNFRNLVTKNEMERGIQKAAELDEKLAKKRRPKG